MDKRVSPARKTSIVPLERMKGGDSSAQANSIEDLSARSSEPSRFQPLANGTAESDNRRRVAQFTHTSSWSKTACLSAHESMFLSLIFSDGIKFACTVFQGTTGPWAFPRVSAKLKALATELEALELLLFSDSGIKGCQDSRQPGYHSATFTRKGSLLHPCSA